MRSLLGILAIAVAAVALSFVVSNMRGHGRTSPAPQLEEAAREAKIAAENALPKTDTSEAFEPNRAGVVTAVMKIKGRGDVAVELYPADAPKTVAGIVAMMKAGCYNGRTVASIAPGSFFAVDTARSVTPEQAKALAIVMPREKNGLKNVTGSLALDVNKKASDGGGARFIVNVKANHALDAIYPVFGKVSAGMEVVRKVTGKDVIESITVGVTAANPVVELKVAGRGTVALELFQKDAPKTVAHFLALCNSGFYKGLLFHRVRPGFMSQGGDPGTRTLKASDVAGITDEDGRYAQLHIGSGGSGSPTPFETNGLKHDPGTISLALSAPASDTGDSQFFINLVRNRSLDGKYCVFGRVTRGMDIVLKIEQGDRIENISEVKAPASP